MAIRAAIITLATTDYQRIMKAPRHGTHDALPRRGNASIW